MTNIERNRMYVQRGLTIRAAQRREEAARKAEEAREASLDAAEDALHRDINFQSKWRQIEKAVTQAAEQSMAQHKERKNANRAREEKMAEQLRTFLWRQFAPLGGAVLLLVLYKVDALALWATKSGMVLAGLFCIANYVAYAARNLVRNRN